MQTALQESPWNMQATWVPSHATEWSHLRPDIDPIINKGNEEADRRANEAATPLQIREQQADKAKAEQTLAGAVLRRLVVITKAVLDTEGHAQDVPQHGEVQVEKIHRPRLKDLIEQAWETASTRSTR